MIQAWDGVSSYKKNQSVTAVVILGGRSEYSNNQIHIISVWQRLPPEEDSDSGSSRLLPAGSALSHLRVTFRSSEGAHIHKGGGPRMQRQRDWPELRRKASHAGSSRSLGTATEPQLRARPRPLWVLLALRGKRRQQPPCSGASQAFQIPPGPPELAEGS